MKERYTSSYADTVTRSVTLSSRTRSSSTASRLDFLDAMRGIAAVLVLLHHVYQTSPFWSHLQQASPFWFGVVRWTPLRVLLTGRSSVIFFFVLSGYILAHGIWTSSAPSNVVRYALRRAVRIYVPYAVAGCTALALFLVVGPSFVPELGQTFNDMWSTSISMFDVTKHLLLLGTASANRLNITAWSLVYELRISVFMPLLCALYLRRPTALITGSIATFLLTEAVLATTGIGMTPYAGEGVTQNLVITVHFASFFVLGMVLCRASLDKAPWLCAPNVLQRRILALLATCLVLVMRDAFIAAGSTLILYLCLTSPREQQVLSHPVLLFCGRISFSLYLTHMITIEFVMRATRGWLPASFALVAATFLAFVTAWLFFNLVEQPAHRLAKWVGRLSIRRRGLDDQAGRYAPSHGRFIDEVVR